MLVLPAKPTWHGVRVRARALCVGRQQCRASTPRVGRQQCRALWTTSPDKQAARGAFARYASVAAKCAAVGVSLGTLGAVAVAGYVCNAVHARRKRGPADEFCLTPEDLNMPYQEVQFFTEDGVSLTGWFIQQTSRGQPSRRVVVCCHPYNSSKSNLLGVAKGLWDRRYSVFMFDFRSFAHTPTSQSVGFLEQRDARAAVACAKRTAPEGSEVALIGASMGGAVALLVGHEAEVGAVGIATDCAFASLMDVLETRVARTLYLPNFAARGIVQLADHLNPLFNGYRLSAVSPATAVAIGGSDRASEVPLLLIHGDDDSIVTISQAHTIHSAAATPPTTKTLFVVQRCQHIGCFFRDRPTYLKLLADFFDECFQRAEVSQQGSGAKPEEAIVRHQDEEQLSRACEGQQ